MYLHPQTDNQIGDWFLYQNYTIIKIYGSEEQPYRLPSLLTPRIFSLEVLRQKLHSYELHFSRKKQSSNFKVPITIGTFTVKNKATIELIDDIVACFRFIPDEDCQYGPLQLISKKKKKQRRGNYEHQGTPKMMQLANKLTLHTDPDMETEMMNLIATPNPSTDPKGKKEDVFDTFSKSNFYYPISQEAQFFQGTIPTDC